MLAIASTATVAIIVAGSGSDPNSPAGGQVIASDEPSGQGVSPSASASPAAASASPAGAVPAGLQRCAPYPAFPDANCTGVPTGITPVKYTGPCTIKTDGTVIEAKLVTCALSIQAKQVMIKNSRIDGTVGTPNGTEQYSFTIMDSEVHAPRATGTESQGVGDANFTMIRVEVTGGNRSVYCRKNCRVEDSWVHGQDIAQEPRIHASGIRQSQGSTILHNRIHCSVADTPSGGGCSANLTGYGDFEPVRDNRIEKNLFVATPAGACAYGGSSGDDGTKPYGNQALGIVFVDNIFQRGRTGKCGFYFPITDFDSSRPGNKWVNNKWDDGVALPPAN
ncbi:hypothetical protein Rhe02_06910 [Rhizocola hellebori]|uniref:Uncharacterized protein n=1 Tax=Rhizocola hellebori TaxID=1392758 RepID=A0A8J3Q2Q7_9ACTN|nr:hypothetical protein Rhe02_06910 [Rhizocola hellebori]